MRIKTLLARLQNRHFLSLAGNGTMSALSMVTYAILYRLLPIADMGDWIFFQFMYNLLDSLRTGFLQTALIKFYAGASAERQRMIAGSAWLIAIAITLLFALIDVPLHFLAGRAADAGTALFIAWFGVSLLCTLPFNVALWLMQAEQNFDRILALRLISQGSFIFSLLVLLALHRINLDMVLYFFLATSLLTSCLALFLGWARPLNLRYLTRSGIAEVFHFGKYSVGTYIGSTLLRSSDSIIIKFMIGPAALAVYNLALRVGEVIELLIRSFMGTAMPAMAAAFNHHQNDRIIYIMKKYASSLTLILVPVIIGFFIFARVLVAFLGGHQYDHTEAPNLLRIFMCLAITYPIDRFFGITLDIIHKPALNLVKVFLTLAVNVAADFIALRVTGTLYGVALASVFTMSFGMFFGYFTLQKYLPFNLKGIAKLGYIETKLLLQGAVRKI